jgi:hypothetical protein
MVLNLEESKIAGCGFLFGVYFSSCIWWFVFLDLLYSHAKLEGIRVSGWPKKILGV